jgi:cellulose synthase (UDP-forming)
MPLRTRLCYMSGFIYYGTTALMVFAAPLMPLTLVTCFPGHVRIVNYVLLAPALIWNYAGMRLWHRCRFRLETLSVKLTYGWAHAFAIFDLFRGRPMGWTPTGAKVKDHRVRWFRIGAMVWGGGTSLLLIGVCLWQILIGHYEALQFAPMLSFSTLYASTNARVILFGIELPGLARLKSALRPAEYTQCDSPRPTLGELRGTVGVERPAMVMANGAHRA